MASSAVQVADKVGASPDQVEGIVVWGNHSAAQFPDARHATVAGRPVGEVLEDSEWLLGELINRVQTRGQTILQVRQTIFISCPVLSKEVGLTRASIDSLVECASGRRASAGWMAPACGLLCC